VDLLVRRGDAWYIYDWKTDEAIRTEGFKGQTCTGVLTGMPNCNYTKFAMQLGIYKLVLEQIYDIPIAGLVIVHVTPEKCIEYNLPYYVEEIGMIVQNHVAGNRKV
jgi:ATP-dependent exoDNAse (exonuclease V) beta subunit